MALTATIEQWQASMDRIKKDYKYGLITRAQFMKERGYMWSARKQILAHSKEQE